MNTTRSLPAAREPEYEKYHRRPQPYQVDTALYRRELFLPKTPITPAFYLGSQKMEPRLPQRKNALERPAHDGSKKESKSFKKLMNNFSGYTSAHGIGRLADSKSILWKLFWAIVCMGAFGMFIYQAIGLFQQYLSKPVSTSVSVTFEKRLDFPAVTICNLNMLRKDAVPNQIKSAIEKKLDYSWSATDGSGYGSRRRRNVDGSGDTGDEQKGDTGDEQKGDTGDEQKGDTGDETKDDIYSSGDDIYKNDEDEYAEYYDDVNEYNSEYYDEDETEEFPDESAITLETKIRIEIARLIGGLDEHELYDSGHLFENLIANCSWKGIDCKTGNLSKFWSHQWNYKYGNCFTFNRGVDFDRKAMRVLKATKPGPSQGLWLTLNVEQEQYIGPLSLEAGVRVLLHGQGYVTFPYEEGFSVSPGFSTSVGIKKTQIKRLDRFNNKSCLPQNELPPTNIYRRYKNVTSYSQQACLNSCLGLSQRIRCKCSEGSYPSDRDPCDVFDPKTSKCLRTVKYLFNNDKLSCLSECRQPCKEEVIQKTISSSQWPSKAYKDYLISQNKYANESDRLLQLNVFFNELNYEKIEEQFSYGTINLLADIGGQLGLWIGISVITCCEVLELLIMFFAVCVKKLNAKSEIHELPSRIY